MSIGSRPSRLQIKAKSDVMPFGKYKGMTIRKILEIDPSYILWLVDEKIADVSQEIYDNAEDADTEQRLDLCYGMDNYDFWGIDISDND